MPAIVVPVLSSDEMLERHRALLNDVQSALLETGMPISTVNDLLTGDVSPVRNFARWIGSLPASEGYHDADACGLFRHSLHVVLLMVRQVNRKWSNITALELQKIATAAVIVGLTHDIAKAWFMVAQPTTGGETWNLTKGPLVQERGRGMFVPGTQLSVTHRYGRSTKYLGHEALGAYFISQICPLTLLARVAGLRQSNNIPATLTAGLGTPLYGLDAILREADRTASEDSCTRSERATQSYAVPALGSGSRLDDFISEFRQHARDRKLTVNVYDRKRPFLLVSSTHTLLPVMYGTRSAQHIFFVLFHALRHRISKASASPEVVAFYTGGGGSPDHFLSELVTRARGKQGEQWLVSVPCPGKEPEVEFVVHASHQQGRCLLRSLLMPNRTLWGDIDPFAYYERGSWQIALRSAQQGVIVPAGEYGFQPAPEDTLVPSLSAKPGTVHRTADLAYQLLTIVKDITPDVQQHSLHEKHMIIMDRVFGRREVLDSEIDVVLEVILDRLLDVAAKHGTDAARLLAAAASGTHAEPKAASSEKSSEQPQRPAGAEMVESQGERQSERAAASLSSADTTCTPQRKSVVSAEAASTTNAAEDPEDASASVASVASRASTAASANRESEPEQDESSLSRESRLLQALGLFTILRHLPVVARGDPASALILRTPEKIFLLRWPDALTAYARHALLDQTIDDDEIENALYDILVQESVATAAGIIAGEQHVIRRLMVHGNIGRFLVVQPQVTRPAPNGIPLEVVPVTEWASA